MHWDISRLQRDLSGAVENFVVFDAVDSTHACARRFIDQMDTEGLTIRPALMLARRQTAGIGRGTRAWASDETGLYLSWLRAGLTRESIAALPLLAPAAALRSLTSHRVTGLQLRWPNDLLLGGAKVGGILVHVRHGEDTMAAVGLGINLTGAPVLTGPEAQPTACVADAVGRDAAKGLAHDLVVRFVLELNAGLRDPVAPTELWRRHLVHRPGDRMRIRTASGDAVEGRFTGLTDEGFIVLATDRGERTVTGGDVVE